MNKDVIYIDVEDDITAIIGKVKASKDKVVALVPPKRIGVLQSAVNLRLLARAAKQDNKHLALITSNHALMALAAAASIPVSKNLQSKPELAQIPALEIDDEDDIIDGASLPVGEHARQVSGDDDKSSKRAESMAAVLAEAPKGDEALAKPRVKKAGVPNFNKFRKKMIYIIGGSVVFILFLIWAIFIAPRATVIVSAKTTSSSINLPITATSTATTDAKANTIKASLQQISSDKSQTFTATGKKDAGSKATGVVKFSTNSISSLGTVIPAGTVLSSQSGQKFLTDQAVTITTSNYQGASVGITAQENGSAYNAADGPTTGQPSGIAGDIQDATSGGVTKMVTVVSDEDVQKAKQLITDVNTDSTKNDLKKKFPSGSVVIDQSFAADYTDVKSTPAVGEEASQGTLTTKATYKLYGVTKDELNSFLDAYMKAQISGNTNQRIYKNGSDGVVFQEPTQVADGAKATLIATAQVGPKIDDNQVKDQVKGKRYGEIQQNLEAIQGVESVDVKFFPFWVSSVPNDNSRITIEFKLDESN